MNTIDKSILFVFHDKGVVPATLSCWLFSLCGYVFIYFGFEPFLKHYFAGGAITDSVYIHSWYTKQPKLVNIQELYPMIAPLLLLFILVMLAPFRYSYLSRTRLE